MGILIKEKYNYEIKYQKYNICSVNINMGAEIHRYTIYKAFDDR